MRSDAPPPTLNDAERRSLEHAEELLQSELQNRSRTLLRRRGIPARDLDDVLQDGNLAAWVQFLNGNYRRTSNDSLTRWFRVILRRKTHEYWRRHDGRTEASFALIDEEFSYDSDHELELGVRKAFRLLPARHRKILLLNRMGGYKTHEIARRLNKSPGRVGAILADSKRRFAQALIAQGISASLPSHLRAAIARSEIQNGDSA